jgi:lipoate-protein ligase A
VLILERAGHDPQSNLDWEESVFRSLRLLPRPALLFYTNSPCLVLGRSNRPEQWANLEAAAADGLPVIRRFSGGGAVYHDLRNLNYSFILPRTLLGRLLGTGGTDVGRYIDLFRGIVIEALSSSGPGYAATGVSDVSLNGLKVSGNAQRIAAEVVLHHGTVLLGCPLAEFERYLPIPPNRPGVAHSGFVTGLAEQGRAVSREQLIGWLTEAFLLRLNGPA